MVSKTQHADRRFLEKETGTIRKSWQNRIRIAVVYPNRYHIGMSNLGFQTVYRLLNEYDDVVCDRAFLPEPDDEGRPVRSLEHGRLLSEFDVVAFSVSFENDFPNILTILETSKLPLGSSGRNYPHPLIIAGGVACWINPEPVSAFIDCFMIGEAEEILPGFIDVFDPDADRDPMLRLLAREVPGVYVPALYTAIYHKDGTLQSFEPRADVPVKIKRVCVKDLTRLSTCSSILTPETTFDQTYLIEVSRGCPHGCRFCSAGYIYRPPRFRPISLLRQCIEHGASITDKIGLVGAAVSDLPGIGELCRQVAQQHVTLSFSSLRADALDDDLISALSYSGVKTATIAPDAGSQRMRNIINKGLTEEQILHAAEALVAAGIPNLKLYFMIGLPEETMDDVEAISALCRKIKHCFLKSSRARKRIGEITVSVNPFVPKPFTPFQWVPMNELTEIKQKIKKIQRDLGSVSNVRVYSGTPRWSYIQALLSRGDRRVSDVLELCAGNRGNWRKTLKSSPVNPDFFVYRVRPENELFPWDFIDHGIRKSFLLKELGNAKSGSVSVSCGGKSCHLCGVC
ncbi:MAG: radical SAM protein [Desulfobacterales bacterium]|nr:radical SAM protein [Desulfobacterales bacterium]MDD4071318.1 radical SAM protein [Desulfobacterales bacterium]MDD4392998.1 radical SAM protein [Desulfobacterales bacterium]